MSKGKYHDDIIPLPGNARWLAPRAPYVIKAMNAGARFDTSIHKSLTVCQANEGRQSFDITHQGDGLFQIETAAQPQFHVCYGNTWNKSPRSR